MQKKKSLGQNFLKSQTALTAMVDASNPTEKDVVLEIGPGEGVLTVELLKRAGKVIALEKDHRLIPMLQEKFATEIASGKLELIEMDILKFDIESFVLPNLDAVQGGQEKGEEPTSLVGDENFLKSNDEMRRIWKYKLIANIPYYITGQIFRMFLETERQPESITVLVQKEVAERIIARNGKESLLSMSIKIFGEPKLVRVVGKGAFSPQPTVDSAILHIANISKNKLDGNGEKLDEKTFFKIIHAGFAHKRKQLVANLSELYSRENILSVLEKIGVPASVRAENVTIAQWITLCKNLDKNI